jgi:hypothetical protein
VCIRIEIFFSFRFIHDIPDIDSTQKRYCRQASNP